MPFLLKLSAAALPKADLEDVFPCREVPEEPPSPAISLCLPFFRQAVQEV